MSNSPTGFAILGAGIFASEAYIPALKALSVRPTLKAIYSRSDESARTLAEVAHKELGLTDPPTLYHDADPNASLDTLLNRSDIDAVIVVLPITLQPAVIIKALKAGKHVLSEKPISPNVALGKQLIETYETVYKPKGLVFRIAENFEAEPGIQAAAAVIKDGRIGKVQFFKATVINYIDQSSKWYKTWRKVPEYQGGYVLDGGVHTVAALRVLLPEALTELSGVASVSKEYLEPVDTIHVVAKAGDHFHGVVDMTWASPTKSTPEFDHFVITGTKGWLGIKLTGGVVRTKITSVAEAGGEETNEVTEHTTQGVQTELASFFAATNGEETAALGDPNGALRDVAFIQAALESRGKPVGLL